MKLAIVVPCYNEEEMLPLSAPRLVELMRKMVADRSVDPDSFILFVNDGSKDATWQLITRLVAEHDCCQGLCLAGNVGHQNAIMAGLFAAVDAPDMADAVITIDADLQDPLECIPMMVSDYKKGYEVVYGVRSSRKSDSFFKRYTAESFYKLQAAMGLKTIFNHADFRLMSRRVILELERYDERNMYLRGVIPMMGYPSSQVEMERLPREAGKTKYTLGKMLSLSFDGITSFSIRPMYYILGLGGASLLIALAIAVYVVVSLCYGRVVPGWASLMLSLWLVGGMLMISVGLVGMYVGKAYMESKRRPRYHILTHLR